MFPRWLWDYIRATTGDGGYAEFRGWRYDVVGPRYSARPSVSDVTSPCPTKRDVWLRRIARVRADGEALVLGRAVHEVFLYPFRIGAEDLHALARGFDRVMRGLDPRVRAYRKQLYDIYRKAVVLAMMAREDGVPVSVEPSIPGAAIGLSDTLRPDLLVGFIPVDIALTSPSIRNCERKELALTGYALAIEAWTGHPVDFGVVLYISLNGYVRFSWRVVRIDDTLRRRFIDLRDTVARILENSEEPEIADSCPTSCPFREVCRV